jgi:SAM-dependent methyltransferase
MRTAQALSARLRMQLSMTTGMGIIAGMDASSRVEGGVSTTLADWFESPLGRYVLAREQAWFDRTVADIFGFHAIQLGLPTSPLLAQSRIPARWTVAAEAPAQIRADPHWLPFAENSLDLIVLPHALEFTRNPHQLLREVYRTTRSEGQILLSGFNPFSLFGAKRYFGRGETPPWNGSFIALYRLKDWLALLGFEVTGGGLDCYVPPFTSEPWRARLSFFEAAGDRWWPIGGGIYYLRATKRVLGLRIITPAWERPKNGLATAPRQARQCIERVE